MMTKKMCWFPRASIQSSTNTQWLETIATYSCAVLDLHHTKPRGNRAMVPPKPLGQAPSHPVGFW